MRLRNWLLTGTSIGLMTLVPLTVRAQDGDLVAAYQAYAAAQASGDAAALDAARSTLTELCIVAGYASIDECIAAVSGGAPAAAPQADADAEAAAAAAAAEAEAKAAAEAEAAAAAAQAEADAKAAADAEAAAAAAQAEADAKAAAEAQAAADAEAAAAAAQAEADAKAAADAEAAAAAQAEADAKAAADAEAAAKAEADAKAAAEAEAAAAAAQTEVQAQPAADISAQLQAQVDIYNAAIADMMAGGDAAAAQARIEGARATIADLCAQAGTPDVTACLAAYGLELPAVPSLPTPAEQPAAEQPPAEQPAAEVPAEQPAAEQTPAEQPAVDPAPAEQPVAPSVDISADLAAQVDIYNAAVADMMAGGDAAAAQAQIQGANAAIANLCAQAGITDVAACLANYGLELPAVPNLPGQAEQPPAAEVPVEALPVEPTEVIEELPQGITQEQIAPMLDSAKDAEAAAEASGETPAEAATQVETQVAAEPLAPPPENDAAAQMSLEAPADAAVMSAVAEQGQAVPEQNVTIINQTIVNNVTNNIVNNVTNNNVVVDNSTTTIGQQNNVTVNNQVTQVNLVETASPSDAITQLIIQVGTQLIVNSVGQDTDRFYDPRQDEIYYENLSNGRTREVITRPDGTQIVTVRNRNGDILRRSRIAPDGREYVLNYFDERYYDDLVAWRDPGADLPPLRLNIPVQDYVLDAQFADEDELEVFFAQPPVEQVARLYSIDEVKRSARIRDSVRKLEVGGLTFDTGQATIGRDQVGALSSVANAMLALLRQNPGETFLIEGHTDAIGSDVANLQLSDLRAATVARILTDFYGVPPENLATQGYGERYLKIRTESAERENRRVTIRRITPLITVASN